MATVTKSTQAKPTPLYYVGHWLRLVTMGALLTISCLGVAAFVAVHWVERQILTTDNWVTFVTPLPKQPVIYNALGSYLADQLFGTVPVQQAVTDALPPRAAFLAVPLTNELNKLTVQVSQKAVSSDAFQAVWVGANRIALDHVLNAARNPSSEPSGITIGNQHFKLDLSPSNGVLRQRVQSVAPGLFNNIPDKPVGVTADLKAKAASLHTAIRTVDFLNAVLPVLVLSSLLGALALVRRHRRRVTMIFASIVGGLSLLQLIGVKALRPEILNQLKHASNKPAVAYIYDGLVRSFNHIAYVVLATAVLILIVGFLVGPNAWARKFQSYLRADKLSQSPPLRWWRVARDWAAQYKYYAWLGLVGLALVYLAFVATVTPRVITNTILVLLALVASVQIIGSTPRLKAISKAKKA